MYKRQRLWLLLAICLLTIACTPIVAPTPGEGRGTIPAGTIPTADADGEAEATPNAAETAAPLTLEGTAWTLAAFESTDPVTYQPAIAPITFQLATGVATGNAGCNDYRGEYVITDGILTLSPLVMTRMACAAEGIMETENAYLAALASVNTYVIEEDVLLLTYADGQLAFTAPASDMEEVVTELETVDGMLICQFVGTGATIVVDDMRINFTCGTPDVVLLGEIEQQTDGWKIAQATLERNNGTFIATETNLVQITHIELNDGTQCAWAGSGTTLAFDEKRVNFTCDLPETVLVGEVELGEEGWLIERVMLARSEGGFSIDVTEPVGIAAMTVQF